MPPMVFPGVLPPPPSSSESDDESTRDDLDMAAGLQYLCSSFTSSAMMVLEDVSCQKACIV